MPERYADYDPVEFSDPAAEETHPRRSYQVFRHARESYQRLLEKYDRGDNVNFKEGRAGEFMFADATAQPTPEEIARKCGPGNYLIEQRVGGRALDWAFVAVPPRGEVIVPAPDYQPGRGYAQRTYAPPYSRPREARRERLPRRLRRQGNAESEAARVWRERAEREREIAEERLRSEREHQQELRRLEREALEERLDRIERGKDNPGGSDPETSATLLLLKDKGVRSRVIEGLSGLLDGGGDEKHWLLELADRAFEDADKLPMVGAGLGNILAGIFGKPPVVQQPQQQQPAEATATAQPAQQPQAEEDEPLTFPVLLNNIKTDIVERNSPRQSIADVLTFRVENPQYAGQIDQLLAATPDELLLILSQATGSDLTQLANARRFVERVQEGVRARLQQPAQPAEISLNGNGAQAAAQAG